jgi:RNA polymerase sigma factor (sigma-70 family)
MENQELVSRQKIVNDNIAFAHKLAMRFYGKRAHTQAEAEDLVSSAYLGLCDAASRCKLDKADAFRTYSYFRIVGSMYDYMQINGGLSRNAYNKLKVQSEEENALLTANNVQALEKLKTLIEDSGISVHVNRSTQEVEISYVDDLHQEDKVSKDQISKLLKSALDRLDPVVKRILEGRYYEEKTLAEISLEMPELSKTYLCRLHAKGLSQLREILVKNV